MSELGKVSKTIKGGGYLFLALDVYNAIEAVNEAKSEEKVKKSVIETSKIAGSLGGAAIGGFIVLTIASGGSSLIVLGVVAGVSAIGGMLASEGAGWISEEIYDAVESRGENIK
ncbi:hypothetical protein E2K73_13590 [Acinetobacter sp. RF15A]|nr:hypothetical protein E2K73_13590 [Acinetobacter sp. RF15A]TSI14478.1 hypothetical protein E2K74_13620 [Acinetobacter sp. RF15B]